MSKIGAEKETNDISGERQELRHHVLGEPENSREGILGAELFVGTLIFVRTYLIKVANTNSCILETGRMLCELLDGG